MTAPLIIKTCTCCGKHFTLRAWLTLRFLAESHHPEDLWQMRNCDVCGSSICTPLYLLGEGNDHGNDQREADADLQGTGGLP